MISSLCVSLNFFSSGFINFDLLQKSVERELNIDYALNALRIVVNCNGQNLSTDQEKSVLDMTQH